VGTPSPGDESGDESTSDLLMMAARSMRRSFGEVMAEYEVTPSQARALRVVLTRLARVLHQGFEHRVNNNVLVSLCDFVAAHGQTAR